MVTNSPSDYPLAPVQFSRLARRGIMLGLSPVSYTHLTLPTNREV